MVRLKTLLVTDRQAWRTWLEQHFDKEKEIWLLYAKKASGKARISYNDAVEEALCFGWIDSTVKRIDEVYTAQRFSPRNPKSGFSQLNKERLRLLVRDKLLHPSVEATAAKVLQEPWVFPKDILAAIQKDKAAWRYFQQCTPPYQRIRIAYIAGARQRPEEFSKRLAHFIKKSSQNKQLGLGDSQKYYLALDPSPTPANAFTPKKGKERKTSTR